MIEKVVQVLKSFEEADAADKEYYRDVTPEKRLDILLEINKLWHLYNHEQATGRLARVHRTVKFSEGELSDSRRVRRSRSPNKSATGRLKDIRDIGQLP